MRKLVLAAMVALAAMAITATTANAQSGPSPLVIDKSTGLPCGGAGDPCIITGVEGELYFSDFDYGGDAESACDIEFKLTVEGNGDFLASNMSYSGDSCYQTPCKFEHWFPMWDGSVFTFDDGDEFDGSVVLCIGQGQAGTPPLLMTMPLEIKERMGELRISGEAPIVPAGVVDVELTAQTQGDSGIDIQLAN